MSELDASHARTERVRLAAEVTQRRPWLRTLCLTQLALCAAVLGPTRARAEQSAEAPASPSSTPAPAAPPTPVADSIRLRQLRNAQARVAKLESSNHRWLAPTLVLGVGALSLVVGGAVFAAAWHDVHHIDDDYNMAMDRTGLVLMPVGAALVLASAPVVILRASRTLRLGRAQRALERLKSVQPQWSGSGSLGLSARFRF